MVINLSHAFEQLLPEMVEEINRNKYGEIVRVDYPDVDIEKEEDIARELIGRVLKIESGLKWPEMVWILWDGDFVVGYFLKEKMPLRWKFIVPYFWRDRFIGFRQI